MAPSIRLALTPLSLLHLAGLVASATLLPDGGQRTARRNAWAGMSSDASRRRMRHEADLAIEAAQARAGARRAGLVREAYTG